MKYYFHLNTIFCVLVLLCSCSISETDPIEQPIEKDGIESHSDVGGPQKAMAQSTNADSLNFNDVKMLIDNLGYNTETLTEYDDYYQIYSDVVFNKSDIIEALKRPSTLSQTRATVLNQRSWRLAVDLSRVGTFYHDLRSAMMGWNNVNSSIDFTEKTNTTSRYFINVLIGQNGGQADKLCYVVLNPDPEHSSIERYHKLADIYINTLHKDWSEKIINFNKLVPLFTHALGHVIGLDHVEANIDPSSIMRAETEFIADPSVWNLISNEDARKLKEAYPYKSTADVMYFLDGQSIQIGSDKRVKLNVGKEYQFKLNYYYAWTVILSYNYWTQPNQELITYSFKDNILTLKFNKLGEANFEITVQDDLFENTFVDNITFYAENNTPRFFPPQTMKVGEYANFEVLFDPTGYKNVTYTMSGYETLFDNNSNRNVEIMKNGSSFKVKLRDYGRYRLITTVTYDEHKSTFIYSVGRHARPLMNVERFERRVANSYELPSHSSPPKTPTGPNQIYEDHTKITFGTSPVLLDRVVYSLSFYYLKWVMHFPGRPDKDPGYRYGEQYRSGIILRAGQPAVVDHIRYGMYHPDSINYVDHYTILHPETNVYYPADYGNLILEEHR